MNENRKIEAVDFIKALAISCVVLYHITTIYMQFLPAAAVKLCYVLGTGCHAFLVISGFGLFLSFRRRPLSAPRFWLRRLSKIYFPYIIIVLISYLSPDIYLSSDVSRSSALWSHVLLYKMFFPQYEVTFGGHFWFISTIIQFYIVFPLLVRLYDRLGTKRYLLAALGLNVAWALFTYFAHISGERVWNSFFLQFLFEFSLGMAAADRIEKLRGRLAHSSVLKIFAVGAAGYAVLLVCWACGGIVGCFSDTPSAIGFVFCALGLYKLGLRRFNALMLKLSAVSYEWYLVHYFIILEFYFNFSEYISSLWMDVAAAVLIFLATVLAAFVYSFLYKKLSGAVRGAIRAKK